ncbi:MAG: hypothetical protein U1F43_07455 [Myxococcota bacterium]
MLAACAGLAACASAPTPTASGAAARCVDPDADAIERFAQLASVEAVDRESGFDLDRDGVPDIAVYAPELCGTGGCVYELYVMPQASGTTCARWVGTVEAGDLVDALEREAGAPFPSFVATWSYGCCEMEETRHVYDGHQYRETEARQCQRSVEDDSDTCEAWHAR